MFCLTSNKLNGYLYVIDGKILWMSQRTSIYVRKLMTWPILDIENVVPSVWQDQVSHTSSAVCFIIRLSGLAKVLKIVLLERIFSSAFATGWEWPSSRGHPRPSGGGFFKTNPNYIPFMYPVVFTMYASVLLNWAAQQFSGIHRAARRIPIL